MDKQVAIEETRRWIASIVIELNLCPFARRVFEADRIRYVVSAAEEEETLLEELARELTFLAGSPVATVETTLLIHPRALGGFLDYNDFLDRAEQLIERLALEGVIQIASFHPDYRFADTAADALENYTNRSPYPMLHLLREASVTAVAGDADELLEIPRRNIETLTRLGRANVLQRLKAVKEKSGDQS